MRFVELVKSPYLRYIQTQGNLMNASLEPGAKCLRRYRIRRGHIVAAHLKETIPWTLP